MMERIGLTLLIFCLFGCSEIAHRDLSGAVAQNGGSQADDDSEADSGALSGNGSSGQVDSPARKASNSPAAYFPSTMFFNQSIANTALSSHSNAIISQLNAAGGWGNGNRFQIDFSIDSYTVDNTAVQLPFQDMGIYKPDSDIVSTVPVSPNSNVGFESSSGKTCISGDCHYLVVDTANRQLIEVYKASVANGKFQSSGAVAIWKFDANYLPNLRGDVCTSADAGGLPMTPLLFTAEEVAAGSIDHAIRFILPNARIQCRTYVRPASHGVGSSSCSGWATTNGVPYGARLRLKANYDISGLKPGARVVAQALKQYGMILADGGNIALTAKSDRYSSTKWAGLLTSTDLSTLKVTDFEVVDTGAAITFSSYDCVRNP